VTRRTSSARSAGGKFSSISTTRQRRQKWNYYQNYYHRLGVVNNDNYDYHDNNSSDNNDKPSSLTIILPAFNEELRITETIKTYSSHLMKIMTDNANNNDKNDDRKSNIYMKCNILVVDDGSTDQTYNVVENLKLFGVRSTTRSTNTNYCYQGDDVQISCISSPQNEGKGSAISRGIREVVKRQQLTSDNDNDATNNNDNNSNERGSIILIADADGSGDIQSLEKMIQELRKIIIRTTNKKAPTNSPTCITTSTKSPHHPSSSSSCQHLWNNRAIIVGNRGYNGTSFSRAITRWGFRTAVKLFCGDLKVNDTQCGFKLMTINAAKALYIDVDLNLTKWTNDVEVLYRAKLLDIPVSEMIVGWEDKDGSKLASSVWGTVRISVIMLVEILYMRFQYFIGRWTAI
jgi:dolichyl-phosphate beta-glucosyltransferase